jgi:hypothetical protein
MIINHDKKTVFISVPKTGCTSIMVLLDPQSIHEKPEVYHMTIAEALVANQTLADYHFIGMVRNPFDRCVSTYFDIIWDKSHGKWAENLAQSQGFPHFVDMAISDGSLEAIRHLWAQSRFFAASQQVKITVLKYEDYNQSAHLICEAFGKTSMGLGRWRDTASKRRPFQEYLNEPTMKKIQSIYAEDFKTFGYAIDPLAAA